MIFIFESLLVDIRVMNFVPLCEYLLLFLLLVEVLFLLLVVVKAIAFVWSSIVSLNIKLIFNEL